MIIDCHVNIYEDHQILPLFESSQSARPGGFAPRANADIVYKAMQGVDRAIIFSLRHAVWFFMLGDVVVRARAVA